MRYIGLFSTIELVVNRETKESFSPAVMAEVGKFLRQNGLFTFIMANNMGSMVSSSRRCASPQGQIDDGLAIIEKALK